MKPELLDPVPDPLRPVRRGRASGVSLFVILALVLAGGYQSYRWFTTPRASVDRQIVQTMLRGLAQSFHFYADAHGTFPTFEILSERGELTPDQIRHLAPVIYKSNEPVPESRILVVQKAPCRAVRKGEPWGGPGEVTNSDLPPKRYALFDDLRVRGMSESEFQTIYLPHIEILAYP